MFWKHKAFSLLNSEYRFLKKSSVFFSKYRTPITKISQKCSRNSTHAAFWISTFQYLAIPPNQVLLLFVYRTLSRRLLKRSWWTPRLSSTNERTNELTNGKCVNSERSWVTYTSDAAGRLLYINPTCKTSSHLQTYCDGQVHGLAVLTTFLVCQVRRPADGSRWCGFRHAAGWELAIALKG